MNILSPIGHRQSGLCVVERQFNTHNAICVWQNRHEMADAFDRILMAPIAEDETR